MDLDYYDVLAFPMDFTASSTSALESDSISYSAKDATDLSYKTAWIEGVKGLLEVYKGERYDKTAISEIYVAGLNFDK